MRVDRRIEKTVIPALNESRGIVMSQGDVLWQFALVCLKNETTQKLANPSLFKGFFNSPRRLPYSDRFGAIDEILRQIAT